MNDRVLKGSFRDPSGYVFKVDGRVLRTVSDSYRDHYDRLIGSGLRDLLVKEGLVIPFEEVGGPSPEGASAYKILEPEQVPFISYPFEWSFSQLKDAALTILAIQSRALEYQMSLKDASAYNVQFVRGKPVLIDILSFEKYRDGKPWVALRQFCRHFLAPLCVMSMKDIRLGQLLRVNVDGIPLDLASKMLPVRSWLKPGLVFYIHAHALAERRSGPSHGNRRITQARFGLAAFKAMIGQLRKVISSLSWKLGSTRWGDYASQDLVGSKYFESKNAVISEFVDLVKPRTAWDMGANTGLMSRLLASKGVSVISMDSDDGAIEKNYLEVKKSGETKILPLLVDLNNPSPAIGWNNRERDSLFERGRPDLIVALALIHHLAIGNNVPLGMLGEFFGRLSPWLIIEFVPKSDPNVQTMLALREDIFPEYTVPDFEKAFEPFFEIVQKAELSQSDRTIYLMKRKEH